MAESTVKKVISFLAENLRYSGLEIAKIILFGSQTRSRTRRDSDIDIVVVSEDFRDKDIFERVQLIKEAEIKTIKKFMVPLDIITLTPEEFESETSLISEYARKGVPMYG